MYSDIDQRVSAAGVGLLAAGVGLLAAVAAGCSDGGGAKLKVETGAPPVYLAARDHASSDGSSEWRTFPVEGRTSFELEVAEAHEVVIVCRRVEADDGIVAIGVADYLRTRGDGDTLKHSCVDDSQGSGDGRVSVRGFVTGANALLFGPSSRSSSRVGINLDTRVRPGTYDLLALSGELPSTPLTAAFRRDIQITGDVDLGTVDLTGAMRPLLAKTFTATNALAGEELDGAFAIRTAGISALSFDVDGDGPTVSFLPDELLLPSDQQVISFAAERPASGAQLQSVTRRRYVDPKGDAAIELPQAPGPVTLERTETRTRASWTTAPDGEHLWLLLSSPGSQRSWTTGLFMSRSFAEVSGASALELDTAALPAFQSEWNHQPEFDQLFRLTAYDGEPLFGAPGDGSVTIQQFVSN